MKYNSSFFINIFEKELGYTKVKFPFGYALKMSDTDAFRYAALSDSGYLKLDEPEKRLIIRRDYFRILNQVDNWEIQTGIFDGENPVFHLTPKKIFEKYPWMIGHDKFLFFLEYDSKIKVGEPPFFKSLEKLNEEIIKSGENPLDFVVTLVAKNKPSDLESVFEFFINDYYRKKGYFCDTQLPFYYGVGTPDAGAIFTNQLRKLFDIYRVPGMTVIDLMMVDYLHAGFGSTNLLNSKDDLIVFEVKTCSTDASQILKYISKNIFNTAYEVIPHKKHKSLYSGLIHFDAKGDLIKEDQNVPFDSSNREKFLKWLSLYIKAYLLTNLSDESFYLFKCEHLISNTESLLNEIDKIPLEEITEIIRR